MKDKNDRKEKESKEKKYKNKNYKKNGKNMNSQRISFLSVAWLLLHSSYFLLPCGSCVTCLFLESHFGIHLEVASDSFCFLINSSWLLVFILYVFSLFFLGFNLYCLKGIHFSQNNFLMVLQLHLFFGLIFSSNIQKQILKVYEKDINSQPSMIHQ